MINDPYDFSINQYRGSKFSLFVQIREPYDANAYEFLDAHAPIQVGIVDAQASVALDVQLLNVYNISSQGGDDAHVALLFYASFLT